jgi:hypothetical protein
MGFNPTRKRVKRTSDYAIVGSAFIIIAALVAWAFRG